MQVVDVVMVVYVYVCVYEETKEVGGCEKDANVKPGAEKTTEDQTGADGGKSSDDD